MERLLYDFSGKDFTVHSTLIAMEIAEFCEVDAEIEASVNGNGM